MVSIAEANALTGMLRGNRSVTESLVRSMQSAAAPNFELQFFNTQNAVLDKLNKDIDAIQNNVSSKGATAMLNVQIKKIETEKVDIDAYKQRTDAKSKKIRAATGYITDLLSLAKPGSVAEFDEKFAHLRNTYEKMKTPTYERYGNRDRLRQAKNDALTQIDAFSHNNFATQQDIDDAVAFLNGLQGRLNTSKALIDINADIAFRKQSQAQGKILELRSQIFKIENAAQRAATAKVTEKQEYYSQVLTIFSLAFDSSQSFTSLIAERVNFRNDKPEAGSVLNLFS